MEQQKLTGISKDEKNMLLCSFQFLNHNLQFFWGIFYVKKKKCITILPSVTQMAQQQYELVRQNQYAVGKPLYGFLNAETLPGRENTICITRDFFLIELQFECY